MEQELIAVVSRIISAVAGSGFAGLVHNIAAILLADHVKKWTITCRDQRPPSFAMYLLLFLPMPKQQREDMLGDLEEEFNDILGQFGPRKARIWYGAQVLRSFWPIISGWFKKLLGWGILGWIGSAIRSLIS